MQGYVSHLRKLLEPGHVAGTSYRVITTEGPGYRLRLESGQLDLSRCEELHREARQALAAGRAEEAVGTLQEASSLWRGSPLADFSYEEWARAPIARLEDLRLGCLEDRISAELAVGLHVELVGELEQAIAEHPLRERFRGQLMLALYRSGRQAEALNAYQQARRTLVEELGIEPSAELQELNRAILRQEVELLPDRPLQPATNLPAEASSMVGRRLELSEVEELLRSDHLRLVTLTGPGGTGKTRLAVRAAAEMLNEFPDGVFLVDLAPITEASVVLASIAGTLGLRESGSETLEQSFDRFLRQKTLLLVLDNFEHIRAAGPEVAKMLDSAPGFKVLVTSRDATPEGRA